MQSLWPMIVGAGQRGALGCGVYAKVLKFAQRAARDRKK